MPSASHSFSGITPSRFTMRPLIGHSFAWRISRGIEKKARLQHDSLILGPCPQAHVYSEQCLFRTHHRDTNPAINRIEVTSEYQDETRATWLLDFYHSCSCTSILLVAIDVSGQRHLHHGSQQTSDQQLQSWLFVLYMCRHRIQGLLFGRCLCHDRWMPGGTTGSQ